MVEEFYPTHVLAHIIAQPGEAEGAKGVVVTGNPNESGRANTLPAGTRHVEINERSGATSSRRKTEHRETKFASVEEWWDSKGLAPGKSFQVMIEIWKQIQDKLIEIYEILPL